MILHHLKKKKKYSTKDVENKIICGETLNVLKALPDKSVQTIITSPSYFLKKEYEIKNEIFDDYLENHQKIIKESKRVLKDNGAIFWNVAQTVHDNEILPLGAIFYDIFKKQNFFMKNWIIWKFEGGECPRNRLFGRYENVLWLVKRKDSFIFNIDDVRVPTKWLKDKRVRKDGKNPEDFWILDDRTNSEKLNLIKNKLSKYKNLISEKKKDYVNQVLMDELIRDVEDQLNDMLETKEKVLNKNLQDNIWHINRVVNISKKEKIKHPKTKKAHPCPFPERLVDRIIKMSSNKNDVVLDIFSGSGTVMKVANDLNRRWIGIDQSKEYCEIAKLRIKSQPKQKKLF